MTASIRILTTSTLDSSPSILLTSPTGSKTLIECGEGCQRSFLESPGLRARSVDRICLGHIGHGATGGLPGFILTGADAAQSSSSHSARNNNNGGNGDGVDTRNGMKRNDTNDAIDEPSTGGIEILGPRGTKSFLNSLRHFMRRDRFEIRVHEGYYHSPPPTVDDGDGGKKQKGKRGKKRKKGGAANDNDNNNSVGDKSSNDDNESNKGGIFGVTTIPMKRTIRTLHDPPNSSAPNVVGSNSNRTVDIASYLFVTPPVPGKFQIQKARELGIPPGPMYARLKSGREVSFVNSDDGGGGDGETVTVRPEQVLEGGSDGVVVLYLYCPDEFVLDQFLASGSSNDSSSNNDDGMKGDGGEMDVDKDDEDPIRLLDNYKVHNGKRGEKTNGPQLEIIVHHTPETLFHSPKYRTFLKEFGPNVKHMPLYGVEENTWRYEDRSPFRAAIDGARVRSLLHPEIYPDPLPSTMASTTSGSAETEDCEVVPMNADSDITTTSTSSNNIISARPDMEYVLIPLSKKGQTVSVNGAPEKSSIAKDVELQEFAMKCGAIQSARRIITSSSSAEKMSFARPSGEITFTGTGSAIPCKHRNVTGMLLRMSNGNGMLLDVGEGTMGQLLRSWNGEFRNGGGREGTDMDVTCDEFIRGRTRDVKAVWISHPHADHHLGIIRFLTERNAALRHRGARIRGGASGHEKGEDNEEEGEEDEDDRIVLIAPNNIFQFLEEYERVDQTIVGGYIPLDCRNVIAGRYNDYPPSIDERLNRSLQITYLKSVQVSHCFNSFGIVLDCSAFGRVVYSGDCRPSDRLVEVGKGADLLIHEATFEDGMEEEAVVKRHSTIGEALGVGRGMGAKAVILTHFSQRYPRIAPLERDDDDDGVGVGEGRRGKRRMPVMFAFDFMRVTPDHVPVASSLTPALRMLYPEDSSDGDEMDEVALAKAKEILSVPGTFARTVDCFGQKI